jgi:SAM-dependent methyltransferase
MHVRPRPRYPLPSTLDSYARNTAIAYDHAGNDYLTYADGDPTRPFAFNGLYAYSDRRIWSLIDGMLVARRASGAESVRILDAGCGPGTWLRRVVARAHALGFPAVTARGFDIADAQVLRARQLAVDLARLPGVDFTFEVADLTRPLAEADAGIDISLCLYTVLNHLPPTCLPSVVAELARVTAGYFVATVRAAGSTPTIYVDTIERARHFRQDHGADRLDIELHSGRRIAVGSHLFTADELRMLAAPHFAVEDLLGLDLFHSRFAADPRWNPASPPASDQIDSELERLEETYAHDADFMDRAAHLLLVARPK